MKYASSRFNNMSHNHYSFASNAALTAGTESQKYCLDRGRPKKWPQRELFRFAFAARRLPSDEGTLLWAEHIKSSQPSAEAPPRMAYLR